MDMENLLELCRRNGYAINQQAAWTQVGPPGSVYHGSRDPRVFYVSRRFVDLRGQSGPADLIQRAIADAPLAGNGQIVARVPYAIFSNSEWERFVTHTPTSNIEADATPSPPASGVRVDASERVGGSDRGHAFLENADVVLRRLDALEAGLLSMKHASPRSGADTQAGGAAGGYTHEDMLAMSIAEMAQFLSAPVASPPEEFLDDLVPSLWELSDCLGGMHRCRIAAICLCGKILEICLQRILVREGHKFDDDEVLYELVERVSEAGIEMPTGWKDAANLVRQFRNGAIHQRRKNPVPRAEHVTIVVMALRLILQNAFAADLAPRALP